MNNQLLPLLFFFSHGREAETGQAHVVGIGCLVCDVMGESLEKVLRGTEMEGAVLRLA